MNKPNALVKLLCTVASLVLAALGLLAMLTQTHSGNARYQGQVTLLGEPAVVMGFLLCCLALLPLVVWLPALRVRQAVVAWWLLMMAVLLWIVLRA